MNKYHISSDFISLIESLQDSKTPGSHGLFDFVEKATPLTTKTNVILL